ncbi:MAG: hypothetical protein ACREXR_09200 [Gammaproteobacteria bacterium]
MSTEFNDLAREGMTAYRKLEALKPHRIGYPEYQEAERKCNELLARIGREHKPEDIWIGEPLTYKLARGAVALKPEKDAGLRLIKFLVLHGIEV